MNMLSDLDEVPTRPELHMQPIPRRLDSVIPRYYYNGPHNCNPHNYFYVINNPNICIEHQEVFLLMLVRTTIAHVDRRMAIRDTWGASYNLPSFFMPIIFLVGAAKDAAEHKEILMENQIYRDIVQEEFTDSYGNSSVKAVMAYKWARTYCPHAEFVLVTNDDVMVDVFKLVPYLQTLRFRVGNQLSLCYLHPCCMLAEVKKHKFNQWEPPPYQGKAFPSYCSASAYVAPSSVIHKLYLMSLDTPPFIPDEPWMGVLAEKVGVSFLDTYKSYTGFEGPGNLMVQFNTSNYLATPTLVGVLGANFPGQEAEVIRHLWHIIVQHHRDKPQVDAKRYMGLAEQENDGHVYTVAAAALLLDLGVMLIIGYVIFCRKRIRNKLAI